MPNKEIGALDVNFSANVNPLISNISKVIRSVDVLSRSLETLNNTSLSGVTQKFQAMGKAIEKMSNSFSNGVTQKMKDISGSMSKITNSFVKISTMDTSAVARKFNELSFAIEPFLQKLKSNEVLLESFAKSLDFSKFIGQLDTSVAKTQLLNEKTRTQVEKTKKEAINRQKANTQLEITNIRLENAKKKQLQLNKRTSTYTKFWGTLWKAGRLAFAFRMVTRVGNKVAEIINMSSDFNEALNKFQSATRTQYVDALNFSREFAKNMGLAETTVMNYQSTFMNMLNAIEGLNSEMANELSKSLTVMAADYSSLFNVSLESSMNAFQSMLAGRTMSLRTVSGIDVTDNTLYEYYNKIYNDFADSMGSKKTLNNLSQIEKRLLRIYAVYEQMNKSGAIDDYADTIENFSNESRIFTEQLKETQAWLGNLAKTLFGNWLPQINGVLIAFKEILKSAAYAFGYHEEKAKQGIFNTEELESENEQLEKMAETLGLLSFDKFEVLKQGNKTENKGNESIYAIYKAMAEEMQKMQEKMSETSFMAQTYAENILKALGFTQEQEVTLQEVNGEMVETTREVWKLGEGYQKIEKAFQTIMSILDTIIAYKLITKIKALEIGTFSLAGATKALSGALQGLAIFGIIYSLRVLITQWNELDKWQRIAYESLLAVFLLVELYTHRKVFGNLVAWIMKTAMAISTKLTPSLLSVSVGLGVAAAGVIGIIAVFQNWGNMETWQKIIGLLGALTVTLLGCAIAFGAFHSAWSLGVAAVGIAAGIAAVVVAVSTAKDSIKDLNGEIKAFATGGFPEQGQLFIANEAGPELVGSMGGRTTVVNNQQIVEGIEQGCYRGFIRAMSTTDGNNVNLNFNVSDGAVARALFNPMLEEARRNGYNIRKA
mgnify:CR=1 FL=1